VLATVTARGGQSNSGRDEEMVVRLVEQGEGNDGKSA
jgi:hypothetical protein